MIFQEGCVEESTFSRQNESSVFFLNETSEVEVIPTSKESENTNDKEISEVFVASDRNKIRAAFEKAFVAINKIEDALSKQEQFDRRKDSIEKKKKEMEEELSDSQFWAIMSIIPVAIIMLFVFSKEGGSIWSGIVGTLFYGFGYCLIICCVYYFIGISTKASKETAAKEWYEKSIVLINVEEDKFLKKFREYCESDEVIFAQSIVPEEYFDSKSVQYFIKMLKNGRADTYKEVINLYEEHLHREKMETMQMQSLTLQGENLEETRQLSQTVKAQNEQLQKQTEYMKEISKNTKSTARAVKVNAFIGAVSGHSQSKKLKRIEKNTR